LISSDEDASLQDNQIKRLSSLQQTISNKTNLQDTMDICDYSTFQFC